MTAINNNIIILENQIIDFYLDNHSLNETIKEFGLKNRYQLKKILLKNNINIRSKEETNTLKYNKIHEIRFLKKISKINAVELEKVVCDLYTAGESLATIWKTIQTAYNINFSRTEIKDVLNKHSIKIRNKEDQYKLSIKKTQATNLKKYGTICTLNNNEIRKKANDTLQKKYGDGIVNPFSAATVKEKIKITNKARYGFENATMAEEIKKKSKQTLLKKYSVEHTLTNKYVCGTESFDSFPELCFYLFCKDNNIEITRQTNALTYVYNDKEYKYFPDFKVYNELIEIKGDHFLNQDGTWRNPFDRRLDARFEAKHQCAIKNNVRILYSNDYKKYINWFHDKSYNIKDFLKEGVIDE